MSKILLVDDEYPAMEAIRARVDWERLGIDEVLMADSVKTAKEQFACNTIELLLCDIEMPGESGLELFLWAKTYAPETVGVFLTCHADFTYAKEAVRMGAFDYLLKPVVIRDIEEVLERALKEWEKRQEAEKKQELWRKNKATVEERFWWSILNGLVPENQIFIEEQLKNWQMMLHSEGKFLLVSCVLFNWNCEDDMRKNYELNLHIEELLKEKFVSMHTRLITDRVNRKLLLMPAEGREQHMLEEVQKEAKEFLSLLKARFQMEARIYIGMPVHIDRLSEMYMELGRMEKKNVSYNHRIYLFHEKAYERQSRLLDDRLKQKWKELLNTGKGREVCREIHCYLHTLDSEELLDRETLLAFYREVMQVFYEVLQEWDISFQQLMKMHPGKNANPEDVFSSGENAENYLSCLILCLTDRLEEMKMHEGAVGVIRQYIEEHLSEDLNRNFLASIVYLNPNYMARLFKLRTGCSLIDYITGRRMERVRKLLLTTDWPVSRIAETVGYTNMSYFSRVFKKEMGMTPAEYRKSTIPQ